MYYIYYYCGIWTTWYNLYYHSEVNTVNYDLVVHQLDVKTAFLNAPIDCELYIELPEGFTVVNSKGEKLVGKLNKSLYGLKQSGRMWYSMLHSCLLKLSFIQSMSDSCVYTRHGKSEMTIVIVWVDDIIVSSNSLSTVVWSRYTS